jgi:polar amino acid transport system substrate-binding protein
MNSRYSLIALLLVLMLALAGCGGAATPAPAEAPAQEPAPTQAPVEVAAPTAEPTIEAPQTEAPAAPALPDLGGRSITIAVENAYLPFNYIDLQTGQPAGWDYDAWAEICVRLNCVPQFVEISWDSMIAAVAEGQFDAAADGITITEERAQVVDFSDGYINIQQRFLVQLGEERFQTAEEFVADPQLIIGTQVGTTNYLTAVDLVGESRIVSFDNFGLTVQALLANDVDAVIIDETAGQGYIGVNADQLKLVGEPLSSDQLGFIYPKGSDLVEPVNQALAAMKADGYLETLSKEYFSENFTITYDDIASPGYAAEDTPAAEETPATEEAPAAEPTPETVDEHAADMSQSDALTGEQAYQTALAEAQLWQPDAALLELQTSAIGPLQTDGTSTGWAIKFISPAANEINTMMFMQGQLSATPLANTSFVKPLPGVDNATFDTAAIYKTAAAAGGQAYLDKGYTASASLTSYPLDETIPTWYVNYQDQSFSVGFTVIIDARSGEVMQALASQ